MADECGPLSGTRRAPPAQLFTRSPVPTLLLPAYQTHSPPLPSVSSSLTRPSPYRPQDDAGRFTEWATTAFHEKKEVLVLRPDLVIFGVYTHKDAFNIVPDLEDMLWFTGS